MSIPVIPVRQAQATAIEVQALSHEWVFINGGQRGLQVRVDPNAVLPLLGAISAALIL